MNGDAYRRKTEQLVRSLYFGKALLRREAGATHWPAYKKGDRRTRPLFLVPVVDAQCLIDDGVLEIKEKGVGLSDETCRRLLYGQSAREIVAQQEDLADGHRRIVRRNIRLGMVDRLSRRRDRNGQPLLTDAQITAAHRYTADLLRACEGQVGSGASLSDRVDGSRAHDGAERRALARIDANRSLAAARAAVQPKLARLLDAVCGADERLEAIERAEHWARGMGLDLLRIALDLLVAHYGTVPGERAGRCEQPRRGAA
jgi:hypothetical protein